MSESQKSSDGNDVLSSFLKLVSEGEKDAPRSDVKPLPSDPVDRYVLTPELLVTNSVTNPDEASPPTNASNKTNVKDDASKVLVLEQDKRTDRAGLEATIAELEAAVTAQSGSWEPDEGENFENTAWAASAFRLLNDADDKHETSTEIAFEEVDEEPAFHHVEDGNQEDMLLDESDAAGLRAMDGLDHRIDEDMLRKLVIGIVREELRGEMGERITRNVRKLVRREINRVLVSRDLD